jgi:hypothetical protein
VLFYSVELKSKEFIKTVSIDGNDRLRIRIATEKGQVVNPHLLDKIPNGAEIEFLETDLPRIEMEERTDIEKSPVLFKVERSFQMI